MVALLIFYGKYHAIVVRYFIYNRGNKFSRKNLVHEK